MEDGEQSGEIRKSITVMKLDPSFTFDQIVTEERRGSFYRNAFHLAYDEGELIGEVNNSRV